MELDLPSQFWAYYVPDSNHKTENLKRVCYISLEVKSLLWPTKKWAGMIRNMRNTMHEML